jgi:hypothetical protein
MTPQRVKYYTQAMERLKARERLVLMDALQYPMMMVKEKNKKHREVYRKAHPENFENKAVKTTDLELF